MLRRLPLPLRAWSGMLLACALFVCLSGAARQAGALHAASAAGWMRAPMTSPMATAMAMVMPDALPEAAVPTAPETATASGTPAASAVPAASAMPTPAVTTARLHHGCPDADPCPAPKVLPVQDASGHAQPPAVTRPAGACGTATGAAWAHAPPPPVPDPPDLHRLCVSRT
ncbi:hypothetical protein [Streptomyces sp. NPDC089799]|uniref:hypothetical protein n=1 Tax=Streptomyces sp. NPDC089799 TaxID=3155066 RepID=UPI0034407BD0